MKRLLDEEHRAMFGAGMRVWVFTAALVSSLLAALSLVGPIFPAETVHAQGGFTFPLTKTFTDTNSSGWILGGSASLTSGGVDPANNGWLRLTPNTTYKAGYAYYNTPIPTGRGLVVTFDYSAWGGTGADGLTFFLFDGAATTFNVGASGGSLGFAQKTGVNGLSNGYLGLGLDEFGNYSNPNEGRLGGPGQRREAVAIRGPGALTTGYAYLAGTATLTPALPRLDCPMHFTGVTGIGITGSCGGSGAPRPADTVYYRQVQITVIPVGAAYQVAVAMKFNKGATTWTALFGPFTMPTSAPGTLKMGFAASTGGSTNYHEIRNLTVTQQVPDLTASKAVQNTSTGGGSVEPGHELLYTVVMNNNTATAVAGVQFSDPIPANTTYVVNSAVVPSGATLQGTNPLSITNITVPAYGQATITFKVRVNTPLPDGVTQISNQGTYTYTYTTSSQTDGDAVTEGNQVTVIGVTAGPNFDTSTKTVTYEDLDSNGAVSPGDRLVYHVALPNTGNQNAPTTSFTDLLPSNTTYVTGTATVSKGTVSYNSTTKTLNWTVSVDAGTQATLDFKVTVNSGVKIRDIISNQGAITYGSTSVLTDADLATPGKQPTVILAGGGATLAATKSATVVGGAALQPGGQVRYTIQLANTGSYSITDATFADTIPANTTYVAATTDSGVATFVAPSLNITGINLASRVTATIQMTVQVNSPLTGVTQISNQGVTNYDSNQGGSNNTTLQTDGDPATAGQQPTVNAIPNTDLALTKTVDNSNPAEADTVVYAVGVTNQGAISATSVTVPDLLPGGLAFTAASATAGSFISPTWNVGALANGASATLTFSATVNLGRGGGTITNTASVTSTLYDANPANNSASASLIVKTTTLSGTVTDVTTGASLVGVTLTITDSQGNSCTAMTDAGGAYLVTSGVSGCLLAPGTATVAATGGAPAGYLLWSTTTTIAAGAANSGNLTLVRPSLSGVVTDLGSGVTLISAIVTLAQDSILCTTTTGAGGAYSFVAGEGSPVCNLLDGAATITVTLNGYQTTTATPTILDSGPTTQNLALATADLLITKNDSQTTAQPGEILDYRLTIVNQGNLTATSIIVTDTLPTFTGYFSDTTGVTPVNPSAGVYAWSLPADLAPGASTAFTLRARVAVSLPNGTTTLLNYATLTATSPDRDRTNNEVSDVDTVTAHPDLTLAKSYTATGAVVAGSVVTYHLSGANIGYATAGGITVGDAMDTRVSYISGTATLTISDGVPLAVTPIASTGYLTFTLPDLPHDYTNFVTYAVTVSATGGTPLVNTAVISTTAQDNNPANNSGSIAIPTEQSIDAYVQKSAVASADPAVPSGRIVYTIIYGNNGADPAPDVLLTDPLPPNTALVADSIIGGGVYVTATNTISWTWPSLASQSTGTVRFTVQISTPLPAGVDTLVNTASITFTGSITDVLPNNNTSSVSTPISALPDLTLVKTDGRTQVLAGDLLTYTLTYSNTGNQAASGVRITDTLVAGLEYVDSTPDGRVSTDTYTVTWDIGDLPVNEARTLTVTARVRSDVQPASVVANRATIDDDRTNGADINPAGNTSTDSDIVIAPYIKLEKRASGPIYVGQPVTYTIEGYNSQYATAYGIVVTDTLPANTALVPGSITGGGSESGGVITWNMGDVEPGRTGTLSFAVIPNANAGGVTQTVATLSTEEVSGSLVLTSTTITATTGSRPWCDFDACAAFKGIYQGEDGLPPTGWNDNPRLTRFDDSTWTQPVASSTVEFIYWVNQANLAAEWVAIHTISETVGNFTFFRQPFCLPLNATGLSATVQAAGDDVSDIYLNGVYLGQEVGAGAADSFDATPGLQSGINLLSVQLLNNRHGGHAVLGGRDHSGLLFNLSAVFTATRPFAAAPTTLVAGETAQFTVDELALGGRKPYSYTLDYGDGSPAAPYQLGTTFTHQYNMPGAYTATVTARAQYGCTGADPMVITVLPATANLLANPVTATYRDANDHLFTANSGAGVELLPVADLAIGKIMAAGSRVPGETITYQITVTNLGPNHVISATVTDDLPAAMSGVTWTCTASSAAACTAGGSGAIADTIAISVAGTITYSVTGLLAPGAIGSLDNSATVAPPAGVTDLITANNSSTDSGMLTPMPTLGVSKNSSPNPGLPPSGEVRYTIVVTNAGPSDAVGAVISDTFPAQLAGVTWSCTGSSGSSCTASGSGNIDDTVTILTGGAVTYTAVGVVDPGAAPGLVLVNTAAAGYGKDEAFATDNNTVVAWTGLAVSKAALDGGGASSRTVPFIDADGNSAISPGDTLSYTIVITNGANTAYNALYNDNLDANTTLVVGSVSCDQACTVTHGNTAGDTGVSVNIASLAAGSTATIYYGATVNNLLPFQLASLANQGYVASSNAATIATDDPATADAADATEVELTMGAISGVAWVDDGDGMREAGEPAIPEVAVTLYYTSPTSGLQQISANTDLAGAYTFTVLAAGEYWVRFGLREGFSYGPVWGLLKDNKVDPATGYTAPITLTPNQQITNTGSGQISALEYGYLPPSYVNTVLVQDGARHVVPDSAGDRLYLGTAVVTSTDGMESPTASGPGDGVVRLLQQVWTPGATGNLTVTTSGSGQLYGWFDWNYDGQFDTATEGQDLGVVVTGTQAVTLTVGNGYTTTSPLFARIRLYPAGYNQGFNDIGVIYNGEVEDYGWYTIRGVVFDDSNGNGLQDPGEAGRAGLTVTIRGPDGEVLATAVTGPDGAYVVAGITAAEYTVEVTVPPGCASQTCS